MDEPAEAYEGMQVPSLKELFGVIRKWIWVILLTPFILTGAVLGVSLVLTPTYEGSIKIWIGQERGSDSLDNSLQSQAMGLQQITQSMTEAVNSRPIAEAVIEQLGLQMTPEDFQKNVNVEQIRATQFIQVDYRDTNPDRAWQVANTIGDEFSEQVSEISPGASDITATVWERAWVPDEPVSPKPVRDGLVALGVGVMLGVALAFLLEYLKHAEIDRGEREGLRTEEREKLRTT